MIFMQSFKESFSNFFGSIKIVSFFELGKFFRSINTFVIFKKNFSATFFVINLFYLFFY